MVVGWLYNAGKALEIMSIVQLSTYIEGRGEVVK